jgi:hypothetical protein
MEKLAAERESAFPSDELGVTATPWANDAYWLSVLKTGIFTAASNMSEAPVLLGAEMRDQCEITP